MTSRKNTFHQITAETCVMKFTGKYKKIRKGVYKLIMESPFKFERVYKDDILEIEELVDNIMSKELVEIFDSYYEIKEKVSIFNEMLSEFEEFVNAGNLTDSELRKKLSELYDKHIPEEKQNLKDFKFLCTPNEIRYLLSIKI